MILCCSIFICSRCGGLIYLRKLCISLWWLPSLLLRECNRRHSSFNSAPQLAVFFSSLLVSDNVKRLKPWAKSLHSSKKFCVLFLLNRIEQRISCSVLFPLCVFIYSSRVYFLYFVFSVFNHILVLTLVMSVPFIYFFLPVDLNRGLKLEYACFSLIFLWIWLYMLISLNVTNLLKSSSDQAGISGDLTACKR